MPPYVYCLFAFTRSKENTVLKHENKFHFYSVNGIKVRKGSLFSNVV